MVSCSHWGMFFYWARILSIPRGFRLSPGQDVEAELRMPDGIIRVERA